MSRKLEIRSIPSSPEVVEGFHARKIGVVLSDVQKLLIFSVTDDSVDSADIAKLSAILKAKFESPTTKIMTLAMSADTKFEIFEEGEEPARVDVPTSFFTKEKVLPPQTKKERRHLLAYAKAYVAYQKDYSIEHQRALLKALSKVESVLFGLDKEHIAGAWAETAESLAYDGTDGP